MAPDRATLLFLLFFSVQSCLSKPEEIIADYETTQEIFSDINIVRSRIKREVQNDTLDVSDLAIGM